MLCLPSVCDGLRRIRSREFEVLSLFYSSRILMFRTLQEELPM